MTRSLAGSRRAEATALPAWIKPQLTKLVDQPPEGSDWLHEIKFDGYRMHARLDRGAVRLMATARELLSPRAREPVMYCSPTSDRRFGACISGKRGNTMMLSTCSAMSTARFVAQESGARNDQKQLSRSGLMERGHAVQHHSRLYSHHRTGQSPPLATDR
ncbi:MAG TPA: hypothetical protein VKG22_02910 [Stellaceae bacterium]|nr:hypothetical protein [Stellaceae bacterium]